MVVVQLTWSSLGIMSCFCFVLFCWRYHNVQSQCCTVSYTSTLSCPPVSTHRSHGLASSQDFTVSIHKHVSNPNKSHPNCAKQIADCQISLLRRLKGKCASSLNNPVKDIYTGLKRRVSTLALGGQKMAQYFTLLLRGFFLLFPSGW